MTAVSSTVTERIVEVAGGGIRLFEDGSGDPLLVLHHSTGNIGWLPLYAQLAESFAVMVPDLPGYGESMRPTWAREPRDLAIIMNQLLDRLDVNQVVLVGLGLGGFIAAEMATMNQQRLSRLVLIGAAGIRPDEGDIADQMMMPHHDYLKSTFRDDESFEQHFGSEIPLETDEFWDFSREMTARIAWKPYMFNIRLPHLLAEVRTPTLLVWGEHDRVVPLECGRQYERALPNARLEVVEDAGHALEMEQPEALARLIASHADVA